MAKPAHLKSTRPQPESKPYTLRLNYALMRELFPLSLEQDRFMNELVEEAIQDLLKKYRGKKGVLPKQKL